MHDKHILENVLTLLDYCKRNNWAGYDPYDALNSRLFNATPFRHSKLCRLASTQVLKRLPFNLRPLLLIKQRAEPQGPRTVPCGRPQAFEAWHSRHGKHRRGNGQASGGPAGRKAQPTGAGATVFPGRRGPSSFPGGRPTWSARPLWPMPFWMPTKEPANPGCWTWPTAPASTS